MLRSGKESACQCESHRRRGFNPWVRKVPWKRKWQPIPVFSPRKFHGHGAQWATIHSVTNSQTELSDWAYVHIIIIYQWFSFTKIWEYVVLQALSSETYSSHWQLVWLKYTQVIYYIHSCSGSKYENLEPFYCRNGDSKTQLRLNGCIPRNGRIIYMCHFIQ